MADGSPTLRRSSRVRKPSALLQEQSSPIEPTQKRARRVRSSKKAQNSKTAARVDAPKRREQRGPRSIRAVSKKDSSSSVFPDKRLSEASPQKPIEKSRKLHAEPENSNIEETGLQRPWGASAKTDLLKVVTWNVASLRSAVKTNAFHPYIAKECPDILCLQETKMTPEAVEDFPGVDGYEVHWNHSEKKGYSGVAILVRKDIPVRKPGLQVKEVKKGMGLAEADYEGRVLTCYFTNGLALVNAYVPNSGGKLARLGFRTETFEPAMRVFLNELMEDNRVLYCGDLNVAHAPIDIHNSKGNQKSAGHTPQERREFSVYLESGEGWKDTFRELYPSAHGYTYFSRRFGPRLKNEGKGWRLDYHIVDAESFNNGVVEDVYVRTHVEGSDHLPLVIEYRL